MKSSLKQEGNIRDHLWKCLKWIFFRFDAETIHHAVVFLIRVGSWPKVFLRHGKKVKDPVQIRIESSEKGKAVSGESPIIFGMKFQSRVGLAAGFDKNGEILHALPLLGFGFAEVGTVTPKPQPGNPRPRLFRDPENFALFNRMGFNNLGAKYVSERVLKARRYLPEKFRVGINIGKNKGTSLEEAASDYRKSVEYFEGLADYLVVNVSSPNTPGLRSLQTFEHLKPILLGVNEVISKWSCRPPLLLKLAPELERSELEGIIPSAEGCGVDGWIFTNTLKGTWRVKHSNEQLEGGWSGGPVRDFSRNALMLGREIATKPIISVGGILDADEGLKRLEQGASLIQIYTGWIFQGPRFPKKIVGRIQEFDRNTA